jgi:hypothetical protein
VLEFERFGLDDPHITRVPAPSIAVHIQASWLARKITLLPFARFGIAIRPIGLRDIWPPHCIQIEPLIHPVPERIFDKTIFSPRAITTLTFALSVNAPLKVPPFCAFLWWPISGF